MQKNNIYLNNTSNIINKLQQTKKEISKGARLKPRKHDAIMIVNLIYLGHNFI